MQDTHPANDYSHVHNSPPQRGSIFRLFRYMELRHRMLAAGKTEKTDEAEVGNDAPRPEDTVTIELKVSRDKWSSLVAQQPASGKDVLAKQLQYLLVSNAVEHVLVKLDEDNHAQPTDEKKDILDNLELGHLLLESTPAVVMKSGTPYPTLVILDPTFPARELGNFWSSHAPQLSLGLNDDLTMLPRAVTHHLFTASFEIADFKQRQGKLSQKNPRTITLETEVLGRLAYEVCLQGLYMGDVGFYQRVMDFWRNSASRFGLDPERYDRKAETDKGEKVATKRRPDPTATVRSALHTLERKLTQDGSPSPFRRPQ